MFEKKYKSKNTRQFKRLNAPYLIKFKPAGSQDDFFVSNLKDISAGGAKFWTSEPLEEGLLLKVLFCVPPANLNFEALARVIRIRKSKEGDIFYVAMRFLEISSAAQTALNDFIEKVSEDKKTRRYVSDSSVVRRITRSA